MHGPAVINVLMALVSNITNNIVLIHIDTLAQVIDGNPMKLPNFLPLDAIYPPSAPFRAPPGESRDGLKSPLMTFRRTYPAFWFSLSRVEFCKTQIVLRSNQEALTLIVMLIFNAKFIIDC